MSNVVIVEDRVVLAWQKYNTEISFKNNYRLRSVGRFTYSGEDFLFRTLFVQQHWPCQDNVTLKLVRAAIVAVEKQYVFHTLSVCW
jgi:hypothetical protein